MVARGIWEPVPIVDIAKGRGIWAPDGYIAVVQTCGLVPGCRERNQIDGD